MARMAITEVNYGEDVDIDVNRFIDLIDKYHDDGWYNWEDDFIECSIDCLEKVLEHEVLTELERKNYQAILDQTKEWKQDFVRLENN